MSPLTTTLTTLTTLAALTAAAPTAVTGNAWQLSCGSSCTDVAKVAAGDWTTDTQTCYNFAAAYSACWLNITETAVSYGEVYGWVSEGADCQATAAEESTFAVGVCADVTDYASYIVVFEI